MFSFSSPFKWHLGKNNKYILQLEQFLMSKKAFWTGRELFAAVQLNAASAGTMYQYKIPGAGAVPNPKPV